MMTNIDTWQGHYGTSTLHLPALYWGTGLGLGLELELALVLEREMEVELDTTRTVCSM